MNGSIDLKNPSKSELDALVSALAESSDSIEIVDADGIFCYVNSRFEEVTGFSAAEVLGQHALGLLQARPSNPEIFGAIASTLEQGHPWHGEFEGCHKDGRNYRQHVRITPIMEEGALAYSVALKRPIDELTLAQERLRTANEDLIATGSMAVIGQLAAAMGHEINNPAQVLRSCLEHLGDGGNFISAAELSDVVTDALTALRRIETVAAELVPYSSTETEVMSSVDLRDCVRHALRLAHNELRHRTEISETLQEGPRVDGLKGRLVQLVAGLLVLVARGMPEDVQGNHLQVVTEGGGATMRVELHCQLGAPVKFFDELSARLQVWEGGQLDGGRGHIPAGFLEGSSQWIGLIFCQQIAVAHGGRLEVTSGDDQRSGSIVLSLPISQSADPAMAHVLVVDDEELILRSLGRMLRLDYLVDVCSSGEQALEMIANGDYDVILCDIMMPGLSGVALYQRLLEEQPSVCERIIFISAGTFTDKTQLFADQTAQPVLLKPVRRERLVAAIDALLKSAQAPS